MTSKGFNSKKVGSGTHLKKVESKRHPVSREKKNKGFFFVHSPSKKATCHFLGRNFTWGLDFVRFKTMDLPFFPPKTGNPR